MSDDLYEILLRMDRERFAPTVTKPLEPGREQRPALGVNYTQPQPQPKPQAQAKPEPKRFTLQVTNIADLLERDWPEPNYLVEGLLPVGLTVLAGKSKVGKSWLCLQLAQAVATGGRFLGVPVKQGKALYLALEDAPRRIAERAKKQGWPAGNRGCDFVYMAQARALWPLNRPNAERLAQVIEDGGYNLVVIDTFSRLAQGDQNRADEMTNALAPLQEVANRLGVAIVLVDHHNKVKRDEDSLDPVLDVLGSTAKGATADNLMGLYKRQGKAGAILALRGRDIEDKRLALRFDLVTGCWQVEGEKPLSGLRLKVYETVKELGEATCKDVTIALERDKSNIYRELQALVEAGYLSKQDDAYLVVDDKSREVITTDHNREVITTDHNFTTGCESCDGCENFSQKGVTTSTPAPKGDGDVYRVVDNKSGEVLQPTTTTTTATTITTITTATTEAVVPVVPVVELLAKQPLQPATQAPKGDSFRIEGDRVTFGDDGDGSEPDDPPAACHRCGKPVDRYDGKGQAWCERCWALSRAAPSPKPAARGNGSEPDDPYGDSLFEGWDYAHTA